MLGTSIDAPRAVGGSAPAALERGARSGSRLLGRALPYGRRCRPSRIGRPPGARRSFGAHRDVCLCLRSWRNPARSIDRGSIPTAPSVVRRGWLEEGGSKRRRGDSKGGRTGRCAGWSTGANGREERVLPQPSQGQGSVARWTGPVGSSRDTVYGRLAPGWPVSSSRRAVETSLRHRSGKTPDRAAPREKPPLAGRSRGHSSGARRRPDSPGRPFLVGGRHP